ncbi:TadE/TadG family type IV pilus assembly protein [Vibrio astriarenae]
MLMKLAQYSLRKTKGIGTIEFVMGFMLFWWMCMAWVEASFMSYVSALGDLAVSEAARATKVREDEDYTAVFNSVINNSDSLWAGIVSSNNFKMDVDFVATVSELHGYDATTCGWMVPADSDDPCYNIKSPDDKAIAIYRVNYEYTPMFNYFLDSKKLFLREAIVIQEYERDQFYFN